MNDSHGPKIICGNWKMNMTAKQGIELSRELANLSANVKRSSIWVAPPFTTIPAVKEVLKGTAVKVGAQNVHWETSGAYTGEVSCPMLIEEGVDFVIVGHSERRHIFGETDDMVAKRLIASLKCGLYTILCVGETLDQREKGETQDVISTQLDSALRDISSSEAERLIIAYEPVWAIGTGKVATTAQIGEIHDFIHFHLNKSSGIYTPILYGGSVAPDNFSEIVSIPNVHGALVGGASLVVDKFAKLIDIAEENDG